MGFFTFILCFLILMLVIIIVGSVEQFALYVVIKKKIEFVTIIVPSLLSIIVFTFLVIITNAVLSIFNIHTINALYSIFMKFDYSFNHIITIVISYFICFIVFVLLQALCLKLININYKKIGDFIKYKIFKKEEIKSLSASENEESIEGKVSINLTNYDLPVKKEEKISYFYYVATSLLTFSIFFFSIICLTFIGILFGKSYILKRI